MQGGSEMEAGGAKSKKALASKANRSIVASSAPASLVSQLRSARCALIKAQMLPDAGGKRKRGGGGMLAQSGVAAHIVLH